MTGNIWGRTVSRITRASERVWFNVSVHPRVYSHCPHPAVPICQHCTVQSNSPGSRTTNGISRWYGEIPDSFESTRILSKRGHELVMNRRASVYGDKRGNRISRASRDTRLHTSTHVTTLMFPAAASSQFRLRHEGTRWFLLLRMQRKEATGPTKNPHEATRI